MVLLRIFMNKYAFNMSLNKFRTRSERIIKKKTFLTLVEIIEVTKLFLYIEREDH